MTVWLARPEHPPAGRPVAIKDLLDTAGLVTTYGSILFADHVPARSAEAVLRLEAAGYGVAGKTNLHEFAYGISSQNPHFGTVPNPRYPGRLAGGSSGGSAAAPRYPGRLAAGSSGGSAAAIAAADVDLALGTDSGGSIRIPAAWCGIAGFKPTYDLVPGDGVFPLAPSYDHVGPMAATVAGCAELLHALAPSFAPRGLESLEEVRVGVAWLDEADPLVRDRVIAAAERFPRRESIDFPLPEKAETSSPEHADDYGDSIRWKLELCSEVTDAEVSTARQLRAEYHERCESLFDDLDLLVTPTVPLVAPPADGDEAVLRGRGIRLTYPFDCLGWPALALPCGPAEEGLPASVQLVGRPGDDARVLAAGELLASLIRGTAAAPGMPN